MSKISLLELENIPKLTAYTVVRIFYNVVGVQTSGLEVHRHFLSADRKFKKHKNFVVTAEKTHLGLSKMV